MEQVMIIYDLSFKGRSVDSDRITIGLEHILICNYLTTMNFEQARKACVQQNLQTYRFQKAILGSKLPSQKGETLLCSLKGIKLQY